jgi:hypothetical protein
MKIRQGFVSNSSSSSFVLKVGEPFDTIKELAEYMIPKREWDNDAETLEKLKSCPDDKNLTFRSCNYDTFIAKIDGYFLIETCHNHDWDLHDFRCSSYPTKFLDEYGDDSFYNLPHIVPFYSIESGVEGKVVSWDSSNKFCEKCYDEFWIVNGEKVCLNCNVKK